MADSRAQQIQKLFVAALEVPKAELDMWLRRKCGEDQALISEIQSLLNHADPNSDPLEQNLDEVIADLPRLDGDQPRQLQPEEEQSVEINTDDFLSKLSEVGVLSPDEFASISDSIVSGFPPMEPRQLASRLVSKGKLTEYQASALLKGEPELLIDKYLILDLIDVGGMGMVFKAIHRSMDRVVAVKMISHQTLGSADLVKRFQREVRVAATLEHPNIVRAYDADESRGVNFLVMEYVRGDNLNRIVRNSGPLPLDKAVDCIRQAAAGLQHAHERGIVHRDIKPGNLLLSDLGIVKILDLGLAHIDESLSVNYKEEHENDSGRPYISKTELTTAGAVLGTASFMAPEQTLDAHLVDYRSDIYSLGCTFYYLLTGDTPYSGNTVFKVFVEHREAAIPAVKDKRRDVPDSIDSVFRRMVAKNPNERFQSISEFLVALDDCRIAAPIRDTNKIDSSSTSTTKKARNVNTEPIEPASAVKQAATDKRIPASRLLWVASAIALVALVAVNWPERGASVIPKPADHESSVASRPGRPTLDQSAMNGTSDVSKTIIIEAQVSPADLLASGEWEWRIEKNLGPTINSPAMVFGADMTADRRTIVYSSLRDQQPPGNRDLWIATRNSPQAPWSEPERLQSEINTDSKEEQPRISSDGLRLWFRGEANNLMYSVRENVESPWSKAIVDPYMGGNVKNYEMTPNGLISYRQIMPKSQSGLIHAGNNLVILRRNSHDSYFQVQGENFLPNSSQLHTTGCMSDDSRMYIFAQRIDNDGKPLRARLYVSIRADRNLDWSRPTLLFPEISEEEENSGSPCLLDDQRTLLFSSNMKGGQGSFDIWQARLVPKNSEQNSQ